MTSLTLCSRGCIGATADFQSYHYYAIFDKSSALANYDDTLANEVDYFNFSTIFGKEDRRFGNPQGLVKSGGLTSLTSDLDLYEFFTIFGKEKQPYSTNYNFYDFYSIFENQKTKKNQRVQNSRKNYKTENCCYSLTSDFNGFNFYSLFKDCSHSTLDFEVYDSFKLFEEKVPVSGLEVYEFYTALQKKSECSSAKLKSKLVHLPKYNLSSRLQKAPEEYGCTYNAKLGMVLPNRSLSSLLKLDMNLRNSCMGNSPYNVSKKNTFNSQSKFERVTMEAYWKSSKSMQSSLELTSTSKNMVLAVQEPAISEMVWEYLSDDDKSIMSLSTSILEASDYCKDVCGDGSSSWSSLMALCPLIPETDHSLVDQREAIRQILDSKPKLMILPASENSSEDKEVDKQHSSPFRKVFSKLKPRKLFALFASIRHQKR
ncbi:hypothetical protein CANTEDRAFT_136039 [Yamadazyma tenuis ATCC 10573]|uniref:Uncharacterized protein n=1 Tax=Candida tenuis (strain ATCC 10573 / BCRC 21748 / CBS 615 / JCM 9827 / NBRC 10315 / NRRL Y-1498 / VKM Y-70) TaxID=590646 RepID=G3BAT6_CANTC|nr:uncharacterized protein CANTEDRAFT_136039 [Yamadazyma tenuis ATCC 10573]EGV62110.1 hypothetical protein CANTEDRAFT_136039 [Yamadazyma tenuis ATCC 10573]